MAELTFLGAARTVTDSKYLREHRGHRVLVDCGLFQGLEELRLRKWDDCPVRPDSIDVGVLTHARPDHVGYLPRLVAQGYCGRIFCTGGTADLFLRWLGTFPRCPGRLCLVHGEQGPMDALKALVKDRLDWDAQTPADAERIEV